MSLELQFQKELKEYQWNLLADFDQSFEEGVMKMLALICNNIHADAVSFFLFSGGEFISFDCRLTYTKMDVFEELSEDLADIFAFPEFLDKISQGETIKMLLPESIPFTSKNELEYFMGSAYLSQTFIPVKYQDKVVAFWGIQSALEQVSLSDEEINILLETGYRIAFSHKMQESIQEKVSVIMEQEILLNSTDIHIWYFKNPSVYGVVNDVHADFFGLTKKDMQHKDIFDVLEFSVAQSIVEGNIETLREGQSRVCEEVIRDKNGEEKVLRISRMPIKDNDGGVVYLLCTALDFTDYRRIQNELISAKNAAEASNKAKSSFLSNVSHELKTPLNIIYGYLQLLSMDDLSEEYSEMVNLMLDSSKRLKSLLEDLVQLSEMEANTVQLDKVEFDVRTLIGETMVFVSDSAEKKGLKINLDVANDFPDKVIGDSVKLHKVIHQLLDNAIKFTSAGSITIKVESHYSNENTITCGISVSDTGIGIAPENINSIFSSFSQLDETSTRNFGGTGMGLAMVKELVRLLNGAICVESVLGEGSKFTVTMELMKAKVNEPV